MYARKYLKEFSTAIGKRMSKLGIKCYTVTVKIKFTDFKTITRSTTLSRSTSSALDLSVFFPYISSSSSMNKPIRLIGLQVSNLVYPDEPVQISFL